jgi:hypothetical protein
LLLYFGVAKEENRHTAGPGHQDEAVVVGVATATRDGPRRAEDGELHLVLSEGPPRPNLEHGYGCAGRRRPHRRLARVRHAERRDDHGAHLSPAQDTHETIDVIGVEVAQDHGMHR